MKRLRRVSGDGFELFASDVGDPAVIPVGQRGVLHSAQVGGIQAGAPKKAVVPGHSPCLERLPEGYLETETTKCRFRLEVDEGEIVVPKSRQPGRLFRIRAPQEVSRRIGGARQDDGLHGHD